jgi:acetoin utilization deacetylase AcuC-like enzyme
MALPKYLKMTPDVFTLSVHGAKNYPVRKEKSDLDIALPDGTGDAKLIWRCFKKLYSGHDPTI